MILEVVRKLIEGDNNTFPTLCSIHEIQNKNKFLNTPVKTNEMVSWLQWLSCAKLMDHLHWQWIERFHEASVQAQAGDNGKQQSFKMLQLENIQQVNVWI